MSRSCYSQEKENCQRNANKKLAHPYITHFLARSAEKEASFEENSVQEVHNAEHRSEPIVDEVHKMVVHIQKKDRKHIGEEAYIPITLQVLKDTLNKRVII